MTMCSGHTHTDTLPIHLGGVDNHKDLLNGAGRSSLYQVLLYRPHDKWDCHDGWGWGAEGPTTRWIELKPQNEPRRWVELGCHLVWWTPRSCRGGDEWLNAYVLTALNKKGERKHARESKIHPYQHRRMMHDKTQLSSHTKCLSLLMMDHHTILYAALKLPNKLNHVMYRKSMFIIYCVWFYG